MNMTEEPISIGIGTSARTRSMIQDGVRVDVYASASRNQNKTKLSGVAQAFASARPDCTQCILTNAGPHCSVYPCGSSKTVLAPVKDQPKEKPVSNKIDPNIVAFVREDAITVHVKFSNAPDKEYTYVSTKGLGLTADDLVVVPALDGYSIGAVVSVDEEVKIAIDDGTKYKWILAKVDMTYAKALAEENELTEETIRQAYKAQAQRSFRTQILSGLSAEDLGKLPVAVTGGFQALPKV